ncbi:hypothetical protein E2C01_059321 [Portunus trituberculatus]|uniref:Uncharacterized protein n=1 Tax=Portunus trituberculatus TaxID=210409 RepID=A0A5B7GYT8_PORTR|nr:hypothetical protein [Portunus trituberculatus]
MVSTSVNTEELRDDAPRTPTTTTQAARVGGWMGR